MTPAQIKQLNDVLDPVIAAVDAAQSGRAVKIQILRTHDVTPTFGVPAPVKAQIGRPSDRSEGIADIPGFPASLPCDVRIDDYQGPSGPGYLLTASVLVDGQLHQRKIARGPEDWRDTNPRVELRHKRFGNGLWGWRAEMIGDSASIDPSVRAIAVYSDAEATQFLYTTGAFTEQPSEWQDRTVWATEWNEQRSDKANVHFAALHASQQEVIGTLAADAESITLHYWIGIESEPVGETWQDSGETVTSLMGAGVIGVTDTAPFSAGQSIRILGIEAQVSSIYTPGAPGVLVISPHIGVSGGETIEVFV